MPSVANDAAEAPELPKGTRLSFLGTAALFLLATAMPWSCNTSAVRWMLAWGSSGGMSERMLGAHVLIPLLMLVVVAGRETNQAKVSRSSTAMLAGFSLAAVTIAAFSAWFGVRPAIPHTAYELSLPVIATTYKGVSLWLLRALLVVPPVALATWAFLARGTLRVPLANRAIVASTLLGLTLTWVAAARQYGAWLGAAAALAMLILAPFVKDEPPVLSTSERNRFTGISVAWAATLAVLALTRR